MKYIHVYVLLLMIAVGSSCGGQNKPKPPKENTGPGSSDIIRSPSADEPEIYSKYEYTDAAGKRFIIQNSYPKGGIKYTDPDGNKCGYAVFWTRIINETDNPLELKIDFPIDSYPISNVPGKYFKILVPADTMTLDKIPLMSYGLSNIESFLNKHIHQPSSFKRTIHPKESSGFYFVMLVMTEEASGMTRHALSLKGNKLVYKISRYSMTKPISLIDEKEIPCGSINLNLN